MENKSYVLMLKGEPVKNAKGFMKIFDDIEDARHWAINHLDVSEGQVKICELRNKQ